MKKILLITCLSVVIAGAKAQSTATVADSAKKAAAAALQKKYHNEHNTTRGSKMDSLYKTIHAQKTLGDNKPGEHSNRHGSKMDSLLKAMHSQKSAGNNGVKPDSAKSSAINKFKELLAKRKGSAGTATTAGTTVTAAVAQPAGTSGSTSVKNLDNGIGFNIISCTGDTQSQTVTVSFTFNNPAKVHQAVALGFRYGGTRTNALDNESNTFDAKTISLGGDNLSNGYSTITKQLPTGNTLKGSITFINVMTSVKQLSMVNILATTSNWSGGGDRKSGVIEVRNIPVIWSN